MKCLWSKENSKEDDMFRKLYDIVMLEHVAVNAGSGEYNILRKSVDVKENTDINFAMTILIAVTGAATSNIRFKYTLMNSIVGGVIDSASIDTGPLDANAIYEFKIPMKHKELIDALDVSYSVNQNATTDMEINSTVVVYEEY